ncbi:integrase [Tanacetum coccineum]
MAKEIKALEDNKTWTLTQLPPGKSAIRHKWVYRIKYLANRLVEKYKARVVAKGYNQKEGMDYKETFAPVAKMVTVRTLLGVAISKGWFIEHLDINNAFLHGDLHEEVYMTVPQGLANVLDSKPYATPIDLNVHINYTDGFPLHDPGLYRTLVGKLIYLIITRPGISFAAQTLSQSLKGPRSPHLKALLRARKLLLDPAIHEECTRLKIAKVVDDKLVEQGRFISLHDDQCIRDEFATCVVGSYTWTMAKCNQQGDSNTGYYAMRWMYGFANTNQLHFPTTVRIH